METFHTAKSNANISTETTVPRIQYSETLTNSCFFLYLDDPG